MLPIGRTTRTQNRWITFILWLKTKKSPQMRAFVLEAGLEPARPQWSLDFKSNVSTNSTTRAWTLKRAKDGI